jgi:hypothetical protein
MARGHLVAVDHPEIEIGGRAVVAEGLTRGGDGRGADVRGLAIGAVESLSTHLHRRMLNHSYASVYLWARADGGGHVNDPTARPRLARPRGRSGWRWSRPPCRSAAGRLRGPVALPLQKKAVPSTLVNQFWCRVDERWCRVTVKPSPRVAVLELPPA